MVRLIAIGLCVVSCVALSLLFVALGTVLLIDLVRHPPQFVQHDVVYVLVPVPSQPTTTIERTGGIQLPELLSPAPAYQQPIILTPVPQNSATCDPSYPTLCIPPGVGDIYNCDTVQAVNFLVLPPDPQKFDTDQDGTGCEEN